MFKPFKSSGPPSQKVTYLGLVIDSVKMTFGIPEEKLGRILEGAKSLLTHRRLLVKSFASWVGLLQSCRLAIGPLVSIMCRALYDCISSAKTWSSIISLTGLASFQLRWWVENLSSICEYPIIFDPSLTNFKFSIAGDSSDKGFFTYKVESLDRVISKP